MSRLTFPLVTELGWVYDPDPGQNGAYRRYDEGVAGCLPGEGDFQTAAMMKIWYDTDSLSQLVRS